MAVGETVEPTNKQIELRWSKAGFEMELTGQKNYIAEYRSEDSITKPHVLQR